jgi:hypothetical protein
MKMGDYRITECYHMPETLDNPYLGWGVGLVSELVLLYGLRTHAKYLVRFSKDDISSVISMSSLILWISLIVRT